MNKKKNLLNLFSEDTQYNYHIINTQEPDGNLIYLIKNGSPLNVDTLEFSTNRIAEELISDCDVKIEKFAPSIYFTEETNVTDLKIKLNFKLYESEEFSNFIDTIKDEYRTLEVKDSLLYKKDPEAYNEAKQKEHEEHQKDLWGEYMKQIEEQKKKREDTLMSYNNDLIKLISEYLENVIEFEKRDFDLAKELDKFLSSLIDIDKWIKINDNPFICRTDVISFEKDKMNVFLTDNNDYSFTATLRFDKTVLVTENVVRITENDELPKVMSDYEFLSQLYNVDLNIFEDWSFKNETDRFNDVIDHLSTIFKENKIKREKDYLESILKEEKEENNEK